MNEYQFIKDQDEEVYAALRGEEQRDLVTAKNKQIQGQHGNHEADEAGPHRPRSEGFNVVHVPALLPFDAALLCGTSMTAAIFFMMMKWC